MIETRRENGKSFVKIEGNIIEVLADVSAITDTLLSAGIDKATILMAVDLAVFEVERRKSSEHI